MKCTKHRTDGQPCTKRAVAGTDSCEHHAGRSATEHRARGQVVVELRNWGLDDEHVEPAEVMLRLTAQAYRRAGFYSLLLQQAYDAAERLRDALDAPTADRVPGQRPNSVDAERAAADLDRIFTTGGVAALIGYKYGAAGKDGNLYVAEEAIRGLVDLEAAERDRAFRFAEKCRAARVDERLIDLAEAQSRMVADTIRLVLADLGHDLADAGVMRVLSHRLSALSAGAAA